MKDKKIILLISIIFVSIFLLGLTIFLFVNDKDDKKSDGLSAYGVVVEKGNNYLLVQGVDEKKYYVTYTSDEITPGTFVSINYKSESDVDAGRGSVEVVLNKDEVVLVDDIKTTSPLFLDDVERATTTTSTSTTTTRKNSTTTTSKMTTTNYRYTASVTEDDVINYAESTYNDIKSDKRVLDSAKEGFITLVDFIFYDGEIKGKKFSELTASAKAKVIYYTLLIDAGIDSKWPNYKDNIQNKYQDIKSKLLAKYMDLSSSICESSGDNCAQVKSDFKLLKESVKLTWNTLKNAFSYAYNKGKDSIVEWYEIFSGKR